VQPREHNRYRLGVPVIFLWKDGQGIWQQHMGLTRDLSVGGAFIFATDLPPSGADLKFQALLPANKGALPGGLHARGRVVRAEPARGTNLAGFAVALEKRIVLRGGGGSC